MAKAPFDRNWFNDLAYTDVRGEEVWIYYSPRQQTFLESTDGNYITRNHLVVKWGEYSDAIPNVRYADFDELGQITFSSVDEARRYIGNVLGGQLKGVRQAPDSLDSAGGTP
jgi:hypothetical protein